MKSKYKTIVGNRDLICLNNITKRIMEQRKTRRKIVVAHSGMKNLDVFVHEYDNRSHHKYDELTILMEAKTIQLTNDSKTKEEIITWLTNTHNQSNRNIIYNGTLGKTVSSCPHIYVELLCNTLKNNGLSYHKFNDCVMFSYNKLLDN